MKCEIHDVEMKWEGSLMKGKMKCPCCAESKEVSKFLQDRELETVRINQPVEAPNGIPPNVLEARNRVNFVDNGYHSLSTNNLGYLVITCPYCGVTVDQTSKSHFIQSTCFDAYTVDRELAFP